MPPRPEPPPPLQPTPQKSDESSIRDPETGDGNGSPWSPGWWAHRWRRALGPTPLKLAESGPRHLLVSGRKAPVILTPLRLEDLEPPVGVDPEKLPPEFGETMQRELKKYLMNSTSNSFHKRQMDRQNTYWVAIPSANPGEGVAGIVVSIPENQMPGPRDRLVLRRPYENHPSRWVEVSPVGAIRLAPEVVDKALPAATSAGVVYLGMLVI